ncbi:uncharacterized protein [Musca autumnalis]|uniref:uncharacterized protein n=1 Tax=Musca autumnalis TaxID=221902 RepID=UPI003CFB241C
MVREQLMESLRKLGMEFPETATVSQLRGMLQTVIGIGDQEQQSGGGEAEVQAQANVPDDEISKATHTKVIATTTEQECTCEKTTTDEHAEADQHPITIEQEQMCELAVEMCGNTDRQTGKMGVREQTSKQGVATDVHDYTSQQETVTSMQVYTDKQAAAMNKHKQAKNMRAELEKQIRKLEMLKLQYERNEVKENMGTKIVHFIDVEAAIIKFTGDNGQNVSKWTKEYERITAMLGCSEAEKFLYARRLMSGSASLFMRSSKARTWQELKQELEGEFKRTIGVKEALKTLECRKWNRHGESLHRYTLIMQELAEGIPISEAELIEYIVEGIQDKTLAATMILSHTTLKSFKEGIPRYEKVLRERSQQRVANTKGSKLADVRCYKCQGFGHFATTCTKEYFPKGACFKCRKVGHFKINCPQRAVAAVEEEEEEEIGWRMKPVQLHQ